MMKAKLDATSKSKKLTEVKMSVNDFDCVPSQLGPNQESVVKK